MKGTVRRLVWHIRVSARRVGWQGAVGLALAVFGAVFTWQSLVPLDNYVSEIRNDGKALRARATVLAVGTKENDPIRQLAQFYNFFPDEEGMADTVERLHVAAAAENLELEQGEYRLSSEAGGRLSRYDIVLPVKGPYPAIRRFIARALRESPSLALAGVALGRQAASALGVNAEVRMTLYLLRAK